MQQNFLLHFLWCNLSNYNVYVDALKKQGYGEEGANLKALWELYGRAPLEAGFSGFVMGALSGAMVNTSNVFEAGKYADAEKIREYLKGELNQNYMGETGKAAASLRADAIKGLKTAGITQNPVRAAWNMGRAATGAAELADMPKLIINSDTVFSDLRNEERNGAAQNKNNKWTSERIAQLDNAVKKSGVNIIIENIPQAEVEGNKVRQGAYYRNANTIVIDPRVSDVQIANTVLFHELAHSTEGTKYYDEFKNYIKGIKGEEFITETEKKMKSLRLSREEAESEAVADFVKDIFRGGTEEMNGFLARNYTAAREITDTMKNIIDGVKMRFGVEPSSVYERAVRSFEKALAKRETGGEEKAQNKIEYLKDGRSYVTPDREAIFTNNPEKWGEELEAYINDEIRHGRDVKLLADNGDILNITEDTAWKVGDMNGWNEKTFPIKMNMGTHIDELAEISKPNNVKDAGDRSDKRFQPDKFEHRTAYFRDYDNKYYRVHLSVGIDENGKTVYSIGNDIKEQEFPQANGSGSAAKVQRQSRSEGDGLSGATLNTIIRDADEKYNSNFNQDYQGENVKNSTGEVSPEEKARLLREEEERRKEYGSKGGYEGHSMSRRAAEAYSSGEKPISKWTKSEILTGIEETAWDNDIDIEGIDFSKLTTEELKSKFLRNSSWHHTGSFYNATDFYEISAAAVAETTQEDIERIISGRTRRQLTNAERAEKAMNEKALEEAKEVYKKIKFIYDSGVTNYKSANTLFRRYANDDLDLDGLYKKAVKKTGRAEDAYKIERVSNDKGLATVKNRILEDYEAKGGAMLFETREDAVIKEKDIRNIQSIPRKSVNDFTSADIEKTEAFARKYYNEMGNKSPFFRAWFGDWRENDTTPLKIADKKDSSRGITKNIDTGWDINVSGKVFNETKGHKAPNNQHALPYLNYINSIVENAVLLDSYTIPEEKTKSNQSAMMHSLYAIADMGNGRELLKLYVEEINDVNSDGTIKRAYQLQNINKVPLRSNEFRENPLAPSTQRNDIMISQLFALVKSLDKNFQPRESSKVVNEDGTPKIVYHGTDSNLDPLICASLIHYQFETIHPFLDGNGRVGRLLITLYLMEKQVLSTPALYLSYFLKKNRIEYYDRMTEIRRNGNYEQWIKFFLLALSEAATDAIDTIDKLIELHDRTTVTINAFGKAKASAQKLITYLVENPIIEIGKTAQALNMAYNTVSRAVNLLIDTGILICSDKVGKTKIYSYEEYLKILRKDT